MAGRISVWLMLVVVSGYFANGVAAPVGAAGDGCDRLRDVVVKQLRDYTQLAGGRTLLLADKGEPQISEPPKYCMDTAAVTTAAFGAAMHAAGMPVSWGAQSSRSGDYCLSHHLEECYPRGEFGGPATANQLSFLHDAWRAVSKSVAAVMPYGVASDMAVFESNSLAGLMEQRLKK
ncbi:MAG TPA: hypothetical protein VLB07_02170 [Woeseiaceae bacterium]|nr:hypothetical protein [Woeseiaceae bacterium]